MHNWEREVPLSHPVWIIKQTTAAKDTGTIYLLGKTDTEPNISYCITLQSRENLSMSFAIALYNIAVYQPGSTIFTKATY